MFIARALIKRVRWKRALGESWQEDDRKSLELMRELTLEFPRNCRCRYVYSLGLANVWLPEDSVTESERKTLRSRLERSLELAPSLARSQPRRTVCIEAEVDVRHQLAELAIRSKETGDAESGFKVAVSMQS